MKKYCPSCGAGNEYSLSEPKFCNQCGSGFTSAVAVASRQQPAQAPVPRLSRRPLIEPEDDYSDEEFTVPKKLAVEWEVAPREKTSLGSIMQGSEDKIIVDKGGKRISKKAAKERLDGWRQKLQTTQRHEVGGAGGNE